MRFLARRIVRLWPVYALCLFAGCAFAKQTPSLAQLTWFSGAIDKPAVDVPAWSLVIEVWAMTFMPLFVWVGRRRVWWLAAALLGTVLCAQYIYGLALYGVFFFVGAWLSRFDARFPPLETRLAQFLGRISYPLYLCHWPIIHYLGLPLILSIPLAVAVAAVLTETVEAWSIWASRLVMKSNRGFEGALQTS